MIFRDSCITSLIIGHYIINKMGLRRVKYMFVGLSILGTAIGVGLIGYGVNELMVIAQDIVKVIQ